MHTSGVFIQTNQISRITGGGQQVLKDGSQVLVRVIADRGNGRYEGSVAGVRVNIQSAKNLTPGQTFLASISAKDGIVYVSPKEMNIYSQAGVQVNVLQNENVAQILLQLGLPADKISEQLFMQFKQLGLKLDSELMRKIRSTVLKFGSKQKTAVELLAVLKEKGLNISAEELQALLSEIDLYERNKNDQQGQKNENKFEVLNKVNAVKGKWYLLPFEITQKEEVLGIGNIRFLFENDNLLKFLNIECLYQNKRYLFNIEMENQKCKKIRFNIDDVDDFEINKYISLLKKKLFAFNGFENLQIEWCSSELIDGTACELEIIERVGGKV